MLPQILPNLIGGELVPAAATFPKLSPHDGEVIVQVSRSGEQEVAAAVAAAKAAFGAWSDMPAVKRGDCLFAIVDRMLARREELARLVARETGKSFKDALGETMGAIQQGRFMAGEGMRLFGRTTTSAAEGKFAMTVRAPLGVAGLIIAANTPIANVAWKVFPALICGNTAVLKPAEDTPATAWLFGEIACEAGLPAGVLNIVHGLGTEAGRPLTAHTEVAVVSFTGSTRAGREIGEACARRLAKVSLELGGKNPFLVCADADLDRAAHWLALSAFSNAGQRCAAASRAIVVEAVYDRFRAQFLERVRGLKVGPSDGDDLGPVINRRQLDNILSAIDRAAKDGATILAGGQRLAGIEHARGCYIAPTVIEGLPPEHDISCTELFGPVVALYRARDYAHALELANASPYGLTAAIHTASVDVALDFTRRVQAGVAVVNAGTYGSEPHMPFGGVKQSGNGSREPGPEALDVYSSLKDVYFQTVPLPPPSRT